MTQLISIPPAPVPLGRRGSRQTASICIPARNEEGTIAKLVADLDSALRATGVVSEIIVLDDRSTDLTRLEAELAGATVHSSADVLSQFGPSRGKGDAMWRSLAASDGDIVLWCDGDLQDIDVRRLGSLVQRLRYDDSCVLAKGYFRRIDANGAVTPGGRVSELAIRPLLALLYPALSHIHEPLGGIYAIRRSAAEKLPFEADYGVDVGLLLDTMSTYGIEAVGQVDLGVLRHRNQTCEALAIQSACVQRAILTRCGFDRRHLGTTLQRRDHETAQITSPLRPPLRSLTDLGIEQDQLYVSHCFARAAR